MSPSLFWLSSPRISLNTQTFSLFSRPSAQQHSSTLSNINTTVICALLFATFVNDRSLIILHLHYVAYLMLWKQHIQKRSVSCSSNDACWVMSIRSSPLTWQNWGWIEFVYRAPPFPPGSRCPWGPWGPPGPDLGQRPSQTSLTLSDATSPPLSCHPPPARNQTSPISSSSLLVPVVSVTTWITRMTNSRHRRVYLRATSSVNMFKQHRVLCIRWLCRHVRYRPSPHGL